MLTQVDLALPWPGIAARLGALTPVHDRVDAAMRRVHQSRNARALAVDLLAQRDCTVQTIGKGPVGEPIWPPGFVGSLAHTQGWALAAVAGTAHARGIGVDVEDDLPLPEDTPSVILCESERASLSALAATWPGADRAVFCAKECVHKLVHPLRGAWLDFLDVSIELDPGAGRFRPQAQTAAARAAFDGLQFEGRYFRLHGQIVAVLVAPRARNAA